MMEKATSEMLVNDRSLERPFAYIHSVGRIDRHPARMVVSRSNSANRMGHMYLGTGNTRGIQLAQIPAANFFMMPHRGENHFCFMTEEGQESRKQVLMLSPGHPMLSGSPGIAYLDTFAAELPCLSFRARVEPVVSLTRVTFESSFDNGVPSGTLLHGVENFAIVAHIGSRSQQAYSCSTGRPDRAIRDYEVGFLSWQVVVDGPNGSEVIFAFNVAAPA